MRVAVLSDIHANLAAFTAVLADVDAQGITQVVSLGDIVGYGPEPEECVALLRRRSIPSTLGNHELGLAEEGCRCAFNPHALDALCRTRELLSAGSLAFLTALPTSLVLHGARFVHGLPPDNVRAYLFNLNADQLRRIFRRTAERLCFVGHTHDLLLASLDGESARWGEWPHDGPLALAPGLAYLVNVGSVGQPRDGDNRAKYVVWDTAADTVAVRRVAYDIDDTARKIIARGFDKRLADRLY